MTSIHSSPLQVKEFMLSPPKIETIGETEKEMHSPNKRQDCSKIVHLHPNLHHAIVSIPQELLPSMTGHTFHTNVEPGRQH